MKKILVGLIVGMVSFTALADEQRPVKKIPFDTTQAVVINAGPLPGMVVVSTVLKSAETGAVIGECQTLVYGYGEYNNVHGFSCLKK